jgi:hypothetical protein
MLSYSEHGKFRAATQGRTRCTAVKIASEARRSTGSAEMCRPPKWTTGCAWVQWLIAGSVARSLAFPQDRGKRRPVSDRLLERLWQT